MSYYIGLMSGTSADGMDAVVVDFSQAKPALVAACGGHYSEDTRQRLRTAALADSLTPDDVMQLDRLIADYSVSAIQQVLQQAGLTATDVQAVGSHGHTLRHHSGQKGDGFSWQIGDPSWIAEHSGICCIADFRRRDIAAGGEGAPLLPAFHQAVLGHGEQPRMVLNLGGIGNLTVLESQTFGQPRTLGFDTGPGNALMDDYCQTHLNQSCDHNGDLARQGQADENQINIWLQDSYFQQPAPKSTGREHFNLTRFQPSAPQSHPDALATLTEFTVNSVITAIQQHGHASGELLVCGGGAHNAYLMQRLQQQLPRHQVSTTAQYGVDPDWMEAMGFAWLAQRTLQGLTGNLPAVTGAKGERILGGIYPV